MKKKWFARGAAVAVAAALIVIPTVPANAAVVTWRNASSVSCSTYTESGASLSQSRNGQRAYLPQAASGLGGTYHLYVWHGVSTTNAWANDISVGGATNFTPGKVKFVHDSTCTFKEYLAGQALNVGRPSVVGPTATTAQAKETSPSTARLLSSVGVATVATPYGLDLKTASYQGVTGGTDAWTVVKGANTYLITLSSAGIATAVSVPTAQLATQAMTVRTETNGVGQQFVLGTASSSAAIDEIAGLDKVGGNLFVDNSTRTADQKIQVATPTKADYQVNLLGK
jgi:hypothetical protein